MAVVEDYMRGNTHIIICDDYCVSPEEAKKILKRIADKVYPDLAKQILEKEQAQKEQEKAREP